MTLSKGYWILGLLGITLIVVYGIVDPATSALFPKCPFLSLTGFQCPGCGSQRAIHQLLQGNLVGAFHYNPLLVIALPYLFTALLLEIPALKTRYPSIRDWLYGSKTIYVILGIIIIFWIFRNLFL